MQQVILDGYLVNPGDISWKPLEELGPLTVYSSTPKELLAQRMAETQMVYTNRPVLKRELLAACPRLEYIGLFATGYNNIDLAAADDLGITVCNVPSYSSYAVAQNTIALLLAIVSNTAGLSSHVKSGGWNDIEDPIIQTMPLIELYGKTMGLIGFGEIGRVVADIALALGMRVLYYRRTPDPSAEKPGISYASLEQLAAESDVISIHCPLTDQTRGMINADFIAGMKDGAILINTARGPILIEADVSAALDSGKLYGVGVDVLSKEPPLPDNPLVKNPRCIITPHVSWSPRDTRIRLVQQVVENAKAYLAGRPINVVNHPKQR